MVYRKIKPCVICSFPTLLDKYICHECKINKVKKKCYVCDKELDTPRKKYCSKRCKFKIKQSKRPNPSEILLNYFNNECDICRSNDNLHLHHKIPIYIGGQNTLGNIRCLCAICHRNIHSKTFEKELLKVI